MRGIEMGTPFAIDEPLSLGSRLDEKWEIEMVLGSGTTSYVYAAKHMYGFDAALKVMHPSLATTAGKVSRFLEQGYLSNQVNHPAAVRVFNDGETETGPFLVMDRVYGETLEARLERQGRLPNAFAIKVALDLLGFLDAIHEHGLSHRRLNPSEVLLERSGVLRVIDFDSGHGTDTFTHKELSLSPPASRSPTYFPPELAAAEVVGTSSDLWATGAILYRMLAGQAPFRASAQTHGTLDFSTSRTAPPLFHVRDDLPRALTLAVERALSSDPAERFSSARVMLDTLARAS